MKQPVERNNNSVYALVLAGVASVGCLGLVVMLSSALLMFWFTRPNSTGATPQQFEQLKITPPGGAQILPPLPRVVPPDGPRFPDTVIEREQCGDLEDGGPTKDSCITAEVHCDEMVIGHTLGGVERYDSVFYEKKFCWPRTMNHDGGDERVYRLEMPPGEWRAFVTMHTPCADLTLAGIRHDANSCPDMRDMVRQCEMAPKNDYESERIELVSQTEGKGAVWYLVVEGRGDEEGPFSLHIQCAQGLGGPI